MNPTVAIAITADDKTAKGWNSAEKRAGSSVRRIGDSNKDGLKTAQEGITRNSKGIVKAFSAIEQAGNRAFSGGSIIGRAGAIKDVGILARGLGGVAAEAAGLEGAALGAAGAVTGIAAAAVVAGAAMWKLSDGWGKGANQLGNMASLIGVSTAGLQKFAGAAERVGVDKDTATGALGSLSQTLNDARYGRNNAALAIIGKLGVKMQTNKDGTVNVEAMLPAIATALAAQNSSGRRTAGRALGISDSALVAFTQGGKSLSADMADYGANGAMISDSDTKLGRDLTHRDTVGAQRLGKLWMGVQRWNATNVKAAGDGIIGAANGNGPDMSALSPIGRAGAQEMSPISKTMDAADEASVGPPDNIWSGDRGRPRRSLRLSRQSIIDLKKTVDTEWDHRSIPQGRGIVDTILNRDASGHWGRSVRSVVDARKQFTDINGRDAWRDGRHSIRDLHRPIQPSTNAMVDEWLRDRASGSPSSVGDNLNYANPFTSDAHNLPWINRLNGPVLGSGRSVHRHGTTPELQKDRPGDFGVGMPIDVHVRVTDDRSTATVTTRVGSGSPQVSLANGSR